MKKLKAIIFLLWFLKTKRAYKKKLKKIHSNNRSIRKSTKRLDYKIYWKKYNISTSGRYYDTYSSISGIDSLSYVPEYIYYGVVEPSMNNMSMIKTYSNKNLYENVYSIPGLFPKIYLRRIDGVYYCKDLKHICSKQVCERLNTYNSFIVKDALDSGGGRGVLLFKKEHERFVSNKGENLDEYLKNVKLPDDLVFQEKINSHPFFSRFNNSSLNTVRVFTYRSVLDEEIKILHTILRFGIKGEIVDNQASGGLSCGIIEGKLNSYAIDKMGNKYKKAGSYSFNNKEAVPFIDEIIEKAKVIAKECVYARILGLDFCVDSNSNVRLLEVNNSNNEINFYQMNNGPLFGKYTDEVLTWSIQNKKSICFDFKV